MMRSLAMTVSLLSVFAIAPSAGAALVYWQNFEGGNGVEDSGSGVGGNLGLAGSATFTTDPDRGTALDLTANTGIGGANLASTGSAGGSSLNLGTLNNFTVTMWVNVAAFGTANSTVSGRVLVVGKSGTADAAAADSFSINLQQSGLSAAQRSRFNYFHGATNLTLNAGVTGIGPENAVNTWTFVAVTIDTAGVDYFYHGTDTASVTPFALPVDATTSLATGNSGVVLVGNRAAGARAFDGLVGDIRIYDTALTAEEVESLRAATVPEPATCLLFASMLGVAVVGRRLRSK
ncbi:LamG domain-containing protein [Aeoliella sp. SH292]|uniref:LamG domain-containing protein n=1 Tax=Aeoliella sp. SH292 TaxID=3454464 RepID=UPI003F97B3E6